MISMFSLAGRKNITVADKRQAEVEEEDSGKHFCFTLIPKLRCDCLHYVCSHFPLSPFLK